jgi:hypothetical protein
MAAGLVGLAVAHLGTAFPKTIAILVRMAFYYFRARYKHGIVSQSVIVR